jgi:hypothetical protein
MLSNEQSDVVMSFARLGPESEQLVRVNYRRVLSSGMASFNMKTTNVRK